jgi:hypothetical protein
MAYFTRGASLDRGPKSHIDDIRSAQSTTVPSAATTATTVPPPPPPPPPQVARASAAAAPDLETMASAAAAPDLETMASDAAMNPPVRRKGGRIVQPTSAAVPTPAKKAFQIHDDPRTKHIPLDRGGKNLPRYMQETGSSKRMLSLRRAEQDARRYGSAQKKNDLKDAFARMQTSVNDLQASVYELQQQDKALDVDIEHCLAELAELKQYEASDGRHETTRMRTERDLEEFKLRMRKKIGMVRRTADGYEQELQDGEQAHAALLASTEAAHTAYVGERFAALAEQEASLEGKGARNEAYMVQNGAAIAEAEIARDFQQQEVRQLEHRIAEMKRALAREGGLTLHKAKIYNAQQFQADSSKYHKIVSHLQKQTCELSLELNMAASERDALVEESKTYAM